MTATPALVASRYRLGELLGEGGMGRVWLARDVVLDRDVAIKEIDLPAELIKSERDSVQRRTLREARAAARLNHPNVAQVYDVFQADGRTWIVMEYVPSRSLQQVLDTDGPLPPTRVAEIGLQVLAALDAAHRAGVRHRDVKPGNVLLGDDGRVVLTDFGIATMEGDSVVTSADVLIGSPKYMSPERARNGEASPASDLWSLGATLYVAVEGRPPYDRDSPMGMVTALATEEPDPAAHAGPLAPVLDGLLRKDPADRTDVEETRRRLEDATTQIQTPAPVRPADATAVFSPPERPSRRRLLILAAIALLVVVGVLATWLAVRPTRETARPPATSAAPTTSATPSAKPSPSASARATTTAPTAPTSARATGQSRPALPAGWRDYHDPTGFSVYVPAGWTKSQKGSIVYFRGGGRVLGIDQTDHPKSDPVADWRSQSSYRVSHGDFPGYHEIRIAKVSYFRVAADWEFTFDGGSARQHVNNRGVVVSNTRAYGIYWQTRDADWAAARPDLQLVFDSFRPA